MSGIAIVFDLVKINGGFYIQLLYGGQKSYIFCIDRRFHDPGDGEPMVFPSESEALIVVKWIMCDHKVNT